MNNIALLISESIKTGKWLEIHYINKFNERTFYWITINDIDFKKKYLNVNIFNKNKSLECLEVTISFDRILSANILEFTTSEVNENLIKKIEKNKEEAAWLNFEHFNNNILNYYIKCVELDNDPYQKDSFLISGIDKSVLLKNKSITLNGTQINEVYNYIYKYDKKKINYEKNNLIISTLAIEKNLKKYIVLYYQVFFNPLKKKLEIDNKINVNQSFLIEDKKYTLYQYIDIDSNEFVNDITNNYDLYINEYKELIRNNLNNGEILNELPEFMILQRRIPVNIKDTYKEINQQYISSTLSQPLKAFFKTANKPKIKLKEPNIVLYNKNVNIDQMRVIYNVLKNPITYVQGPPGTGKTQTILNVLLNSFLNKKKVLICSSNNKPIDGIIEKLSFTYDNKKIPFPFLRLGNNEEVGKSLLKINELYNLKIDIIPNNFIIDKIKNKNIENNKELVKLLEQYEKRKELKEKIKNAKNLLKYLKESIDSNKSKKKILSIFQSKNNNRTYINIKDQLENMEKEYNQIPNITNEDVLNEVYLINETEEFKHYIYLESIKFINKLKTAKYKELISICRINNINELENNITEFNKWCSDDNNMKLLENAFPIIMTTNISASKIGTSNNKFDLVIMDEAGQANCATALLPISRAKNLLLVGDTNQLKPVIVLEDVINEKLKRLYNISEDYDYKKYSILDLMTSHDKISKNIMLTYHYRCGKKIIDFSNKRFYKNKLNLNNIKEEGNLELLNVKNVNSKIRNQNFEEAKAIVEYVKRNNLKDTAIITPFVSQQNLINTMLKNNNITDVKCGTIHSVQGDEKNTIIISTSISPKTSKKTFEWLKNNAELTNVAVTRAKKNLIVAADVESLNLLSKDKKDDLYSLVNYIKNNGNITVDPNIEKTIEIGLSNGSLNEDMFFQTISHFCTVNKEFEVRRNVKLSNLFYNDPILSKSKLEFDIVLYKIKNNSLKPAIAIELQGDEHFGNYDREKSDARKSAICKEKNISLIEIPNSFVKSYETVKELIINVNKKNKDQLELFL